MQSIPKSGLYFPNKLARISLQALQEVTGKHGLNSVLHTAHLEHLIDSLPPDNLDRKFDFADYSAIFGALEELYGPRGGRVLALRAGRQTFEEGLRQFGTFAGVGNILMEIMPRNKKAIFILSAACKVFSQLSDQLTTVEDKGDYFLYRLHQCPCCYGRTTDKPCCHMAGGLALSALKWVTGGKEYKATEVACKAVGDPYCDFHIDKEPIA